MCYNVYIYEYYSYYRYYEYRGVKNLNAKYDINKCKIV